MALRRALLERRDEGRKAKCLCEERKGIKRDVTTCDREGNECTTR
jgi:hypothetical protein